jgi:hypothetical protein
LRTGAEQFVYELGHGSIAGVIGKNVVV